MLLQVEREVVPNRLKITNKPPVETGGFDLLEQYKKRDYFELS